MKYLLKNITIFEGKNSRGAYSWLQAELFNDADVFANPAQLPRYYNMTQQVVDIYKPYTERDNQRSNNELTVLVVNETSFKEAIAKGEIPDYGHIDQIFSVTVPLTAMYARIYKTDRYDANNNLIGKAGDFIRNANGEVVPQNSLTIYIKKGFDPNTNEWTWVEAPEQAARRILARNYKLYESAPSATTPAQAPSAPDAAQQEQSVEDQIAEQKAKLEALMSQQKK